MSVGRRDYTWGFLNESATEGRYTESFVKGFKVNIDTGVTETLYTYTVPAGYKLAINRIAVSTTAGVGGLLSVLKGAVVQLDGFYNETYYFNFSDQNPFYYLAGEVFTLRATNQEETMQAFFGYVVGALEQLIS